MELDIKNMPQQDMEHLVKSLELVSARVLDSVVKTNQLASSYTPEMQNLFSQWVECLAAPIIAEAEEKGTIDPQKLALEIGVTPATILSLALTLHRDGKLVITELKARPGNGGNTEVCGCLKSK